MYQCCPIFAVAGLHQACLTNCLTCEQSPCYKFIASLGMLMTMMHMLVARLSVATLTCGRE